MAMSLLASPAQHRRFLELEVSQEALKERPRTRLKTHFRPDPQNIGIDFCWPTADKTCTIWVESLPPTCPQRSKGDLVQYKRKRVVVFFINSPVLCIITSQQADKSVTFADRASWLKAAELWCTNMKIHQRMSSLTTRAACNECSLSYT